MRSSIISTWVVLFSSISCMSKVNGDTTELMDTVINMRLIKDPVNLVKHLIDFGADAKVRDDAGNTALMYAVAGGNEKMVELLIPASDAKNKNNYGTTPLMYASEAGNKKIVELLLPHTIYT